MRDAVATLLFSRAHDSVWSCSGTRAGVRFSPMDVPTFVDDRDGDRSRGSPETYMPLSVYDGNPVADATCGDHQDKEGIIWTGEIFCGR